MCVDGTVETVQAAISRRQAVIGGGLAAGALAMAATPVRAQMRQVQFSGVLDLTHDLDKFFPTYGGTQDYVELEQIFSTSREGYDTYRWKILEHVGTHLDAPSHFQIGGRTAVDLSVEELVAPLAKIDVSDKAASNADYELTPDDILAWQREHGRLPYACCVAMDSGWADRVSTDGFRNADGSGVMYFPGFHVEAAEFLESERNVVGMAVDTAVTRYWEFNVF
ncbi:cyclase family protein [Roseibium sp. TrichSKD4]|uniref:cyclase family protein n=1 Tax=Roseibium sp. TrichSKD4 TaxID=744980 RepID=UPI0001E56837|nr:cyclase family protein [Roseibium sp. TrichSKD4]EFO31262.1 cyclase family protein [Roseibium sp. TrichSKD4]